MSARLPFTTVHATVVAALVVTTTFAINVSSHDAVARSKKTRAGKTKIRTGKTKIRSGKTKIRPGQVKRVAGVRVKLRLVRRKRNAAGTTVADYLLKWGRPGKDDEAHLKSDHMCMEHRSFGMLMQAAGLKGGDRKSKLRVAVKKLPGKKMIGEDRAHDIAYRIAKKRRHPTGSSAATESNGCYSVVFRGFESKTEMEVQVGAYSGEVLDTIVRRRGRN